jgi:hypothetical protein
MSSIAVDFSEGGATIIAYKGRVSITEQTVRELSRAVEQAKGGEKVETLNVSSEFSGLSFYIDLEQEPNTQESLGYRINATLSTFKGEEGSDRER